MRYVEIFSYTILKQGILFFAEAGNIPGDSFYCASEGFYPHPMVCNKFYRCVNQKGQLVAFPFDCAPGTVFDTHLKTCNFKHKVALRPGCLIDWNTGGEVPSNEWPQQAIPGGNQEPVFSEFPEASKVKGLGVLPPEQNIDPRQGFDFDKLDDSYYYDGA